MLAETLAVGFNQAVPVLRLLLAHFIKQLGGVRVVAAQAVSKVAVDAAIFFFKRNSERQNFAF